MEMFLRKLSLPLSLSLSLSQDTCSVLSSRLSSPSHCKCGNTNAAIHLHIGLHLHNCRWRTSPALAHLKEHLSWRVRWERDTCAGCYQTRGEDTPMLTCKRGARTRRCTRALYLWASVFAGKLLS